MCKLTPNLLYLEAFKVKEIEQEKARMLHHLLVLVCLLVVFVNEISTAPTKPVELESDLVVKGGTSTKEDLEQFFKDQSHLSGVNITHQQTNESSSNGIWSQIPGMDMFSQFYEIFNQIGVPFSNPAETAQAIISLPTDMFVQLMQDLDSRNIPKD